MSQRILVTGATGFIGRRLCERLRQDGHKVVAFARHKQEGPWDEFVTGDLSGIVTSDLCDDIDVVFHLAGVAHAMKLPGSQESIYQQVNVDGTLHLLDLVRESHVRAFVFFSSIKAMADPGDECVDEKFSAEPRDAYGQSKRQAEQNVLEFGQRYNFHVSCLRPTLVYGPNPKGNIQRMMRAIARGRFPAFGDFHNRRSMVSVDDLIDAAILAAYDPAADGQTYIVSDGQDYSTRQIYESICQAMNKSVAKVNWPIWPFRLLARAGDILAAVTGRPVPFTSETWQRIHGSACYISEKIKNELGWQPKETLQSLLPDMVASLEKD